MTSLASLGLRRAVTQFRGAARGLQIVRNYADLRAWKAGPYPRTEEERRAAAAKYNLIPEDYEPWEEEKCIGDYPKIDAAGWDARDPHEDYDDEFDRYYYGEPIHADSELWGMQRADPNLKFDIPIWKLWLTTFGFVFGFIITDITLGMYDVRINLPLKPKQWPGPGKVHYTFEPEYD